MTRWLPMRAGNAVDQRRHLVIVLNMRIEVALLLHDGLGSHCGQAHQIESETRIERIDQRIEPLAEQAIDDLRRA